MRKRALGALLGAVLVLGAGPAPAGEEAPVTVSPNPVRQNRNLTIVAADCVSGDGWEAFVLISIYDSAEATKSAEMEKYYSYTPANESGTTEASVKIKKAKYKKGLYYVYVACIHEFDDGGTGIWYEVEKEVKVKKAKRH